MNLRRQETSRSTLGGRLRRALLVRFAAALCLGCVVFLPAARAEEPQRAMSEDLEDVLTAKVLGQEEARDFRYTATAADGTPSEDREKVWSKVDRSEDDYAFGSVVLLPPEKKDYPQGWLFVGKEVEGEWKVALEGTKDFASLSGEAPDSVVGEEEKDLFSESVVDEGATREASAVRTGLRLPWKVGAVWNLTGGPHGWSTGYDRPYSALDLTGRAGEGQKVRAAGKGRVYRMCPSNRGFLRVVHPNGYATDYYHLARNIAKPQGAPIGAGDYLGVTGTDVSCGGGASGRHVHFALRRGGNYVAVDDRSLGGWTFQQGTAYNGYAERSGVIRRPVSPLRNYRP